jgi:hypothetical protein
MNRKSNNLVFKTICILILFGLLTKSVIFLFVAVTAVVIFKEIF